MSQRRLFVDPETHRIMFKPHTRSTTSPSEAPPPLKHQKERVKMRPYGHDGRGSAAYRR